ncbi:MAG: hypothetical protein R2828_29810 [Saprospiraceae bacterium]
MNEKNQIAVDIINSLKKDKQSFLNDVEKSIKEYIEKKSPIECLTLTTQKYGNSKKVRWEPSLNPTECASYVKRLIPFLRKKKEYKGEILDSGLSDGVVEVVIKSFTKFYQKNNDVLAKKLVEAILVNEKASNAFWEGVLSSKFTRVSKSYIKSAAFDTVINTLKTQYDTVAPVVKESATPIIVKATTLAASSPIIKAIVTKLTIFLAAHLHIILAKLIAMPAVKALIVGLLKKYVIAAIIAGFLKVIIAKTGLSIGAAVIYCPRDKKPKIKTVEI